MSVFVVFLVVSVCVCECVCVCVVEYIERCIIYVSLCVYIFIYYPTLKTFHSPMRSRVTLYHFVCMCVYVCPLRAGLFAFGSTCFSFNILPIHVGICVLFSFFQFAWSLKNPFVMISLVVSVVVAILWECSHILMKDCSSQSQPAVVVIVSRMST